RQDPRRRRRGGAVIIEFAVVCAFLAVVVVGMIELSRAIRAKETLINASRRGANVAIKAGKNYSDIQSALDDGLAAGNQLPATLTNGKAHLVVTVATWDAKKQAYGPDVKVNAANYDPQPLDKIGVKVSADASDLGLVLLNYMAGMIESETVYMMK